ncbi:hypothetical protein G7043_10205 [Lentzea sp. NEAU-D13]|uniref:Uncharacterized protein n=1 Tax=Lentzea alba TaxID=2714351 RepID=A0A7C9VPX4_9PSEU|nr:hypothetical protein [Lentzea alba]NGY59295.1 hypothetical protein [Lentzea alba]
MLLRTVVGAVAGTLAGIGFVASLEALTRYCYEGPGRRGCGTPPVQTFGLGFSLWMIVAAALVYTGFRLLRMERGWWVAGIGSGLWFVLILAVIYLRMNADGMYQEEGHEFLAAGYLAAAGASYAIAALCTGRRRAW